MSCESSQVAQTLFGCFPEWLCRGWRWLCRNRSRYTCRLPAGLVGRGERKIVLRRLLFGGAVAAAVVAYPATAFADSCSNVSRAPAPCGFNCQAPVIDGNWVWLPSIGVPEAAWGFAPPGGADSVVFGLPGANGNYTNGQTSSLLGMSANCPPGANPSRQTSHGIQTGCV